jgi:hypothetical protein
MSELSPSALAPVGASFEFLSVAMWGSRAEGRGAS